MSPPVLGIDTTGPGGGAALLLDRGEILRATVPDEVRRGRTLVPLIAGLLDQAGLRPGDLDLVACGVGPGSFTGIRIGIATAAMLAYAAGIEVVAVGSLHGRAANAPADATEVCVQLDARRGRLYSALFAREGVDWRLVGEYGHGAAPTDLPAGTLLLGDRDAPVRPDVIARLGDQGERISPLGLRPLYMRRSDPELRRSDSNRKR